MEQQQIFKWFLREKICIYVYEIFTKYAWNIYTFITCKVFKILFYSKLVVNWKNKNIHFARVKT